MKNNIFIERLEKIKLALFITLVIALILILLPIIIGVQAETEGQTTKEPTLPEWAQGQK